MMIPTAGEEEVFSPETTVEAALLRYLERVSAHKSPPTHAREQRKARQITARLGKLPLSEVTALDLSRYRDLRLREASAAIVQGDLDLLRDLFEVAVGSWGLELDGNPVNGVSPPRAVPERARSLGPGEVVRLLAACDRRPTPMLGWIVRIALQTAMNKDEILKMRTDDLDLKARVATIPRTLGRPERLVPLSRGAVRVFEDVLNYSDRPDREELLFYGSYGALGVRHPLTIDKAFRAVAFQARVKGLRFSDLRNEALSRLEQAGLTEVERFTLAGLTFPRGVKRPPRPTVAELVARLDEVGFGLVGQ
ncbi:MAG: tyrosine-type recombinase/integrase [Magnetococcales bacterium]|nr:tyrosine-type recombinase/integrase [Magnetococcales bacterium]